MTLRPAFATSALIVGLIALASVPRHGSAAEAALDEAKIRTAGIRRLESQHLVLYTDVASAPEVDELPQVFDQAFERWCDYFGIDPARHRTWRMRASLMDDPARFQRAGLFPADVPKFLNGYTRGHEFWLYNQTSPYYCRHLLLHEGVHGIMFTLLSDHAPPWYIEGMAELLATHRWQDGRLELPYFPRKSEEVPKLGRIEIVQTDVAKYGPKQLIDVMAYDNRAHLKNEPYGWSWAAAAFLDGHPRYRDRFRKLISLLREPRDFNTAFWEAYGQDAPYLAEEWLVFIADIAHGYDFSRTAIDFTPGTPLTGRGAKVTVEADRGWQNTGVHLDAGKLYQLEAHGRYQVAATTKPWMSEPNGVSIRYVQGRPLGLLLGTIRPENPANQKSASQSSPFAKSFVVGTGTKITPDRSGTLYLKINDSAGQLHDNAGHAEATITSE